MMNLFEIMQSAQNGQAIQNMARQYGLSLQQTQAAIEAVLPAFTMGLQRQTADPYSFGNLATMMASASPFAKFYDADGDGIPDRAQSAGQNVLSQIFGSREVSAAIAQQAAATSGVGVAIMKQMLPIIAATLMGGLFKSASSQGLGGIFGQFAEMMKGFGGAPAPAPQPQANPANPWDQILGGMFGAGQAGRGTQGGGPFGGQIPGADQMGGLLGQILTGMLGGGAGAPQPAPDAAPAPKPAAPNARRPAPSAEPGEGPAPQGAPGPGSIGLDALNQMFEHGRQIQSDHQDALKSILDAMLGGQRR